ncbi:MAG: diaminopimelate decarboxylase [Firmicutes bacterium]|nr:diaminopimelate decarboxylase [Bacillota bacterium]
MDNKMQASDFETTDFLTAPISARLLPSTSFIDDNGKLFIGSVAVSEIVKEFGTPLFIYDEENLRQNILEAKAAFSSGVAYASKAFLCKAMAALVAEYGINIDVSSLGEMYIAMESGVPGENIVLHGNNKSYAEIVFAVENGIKTVIDSSDEINLVHAVTSNLKKKCRALIRVTPGVEAHTHEFIKTGHEDSKFGFPLADSVARSAIEELRDDVYVDLIGVHSHIGSQIFELPPYAEAMAILAPIISEYGFSELCIGGGLGVPYLGNEYAPSISEWAQAAMTAAEQAGISKEVAVTAEPGRSIVARTAITCYTVGSIKDIPQVRTYLAVDGGMSDNPRPILYGSGYEVFLPSRANAVREKAVRVVGKHCESGDILVSNGFIPFDTRVGDTIATPVTGAYGYSMASHYNRLQRPAVVFVRDGNAKLVCRRESLEDLLRFDM